MYGRHEEPLRYFVHVPRILHSPLPVPFTKVRSNLLQVLVIEFALEVQPGVHRSTGRIVVLFAFRTLRNELIWE